MSENREPVICGVGAVVRDILIELSAPLQTDRKNSIKKIRRLGGGPCATALVAASKLGSRCKYIGVIADDEAGDFLLEDFQRYGVSTEYVTRAEGKNSLLSYVLINPFDGTRTCLVSRDNIPEVVLSCEQKQVVATSDLLLVDGNNLDAAISAATIAQANGVNVMIDAGGMYKGIERLMPLADYLVPSEEFALTYTGTTTAEDAAIAMYEEYKPKCVVITQGENGGICCLRGEITYYDSFKVEVKDTNGAGDVFHGALATAVCRGWDIDKACVFASAAAALKCTGIGSRSSAPDYDTVIRFIRSSEITNE